MNKTRRRKARARRAAIQRARSRVLSFRDFWKHHGVQLYPWQIEILTYAPPEFWIRGRFEAAGFRS